jgi:acetolactate synthase-1/2/3 large subunit
MAIKGSDFIIDFLQKKGCEKFFGVTGGAAVHLFDSVEKNPKTEAIYFNHEQSASFAVNSYSRYKNKLGVGIFTTGPGATNAFQLHGLILTHVFSSQVNLEPIKQ